MQLTKIPVDPALWDSVIQQLLEQTITRAEAAEKLGLKYNTFQARLKRAGLTQKLECFHGIRGDRHHFSLAKTNPERKVLIDAAVEDCLTGKNSVMYTWKRKYRDLIDYSDIAARVKKVRDQRNSLKSPQSKPQNNHQNGS